MPPLVILLGVPGKVDDRLTVNAPVLNRKLFVVNTPPSVPVAVTSVFRPLPQVLAV